MSESADQSKEAEKVEQVKVPEQSSIPRRQGLKNFVLALKHINDASVADNVKQRFSDYVTIFLVVLWRRQE